MTDAGVAIGPEPLDLAQLIRCVELGPSEAAGANGAIVTFVGTVRAENRGHRVLWLEYEAFEPLALKAFRAIQDEARSEWPTARLAFHHRIGRLALGEASVAIVAASPHRAEAFAACRYVIERLKQIAPVWKREYFEGGDVWIEGATADPSDEGARKEALRRSCG